MRQIKFRAWDKKEKKMHDVVEIILDPEFGGVVVWGKVYHDHDTGDQEADKDFLPWDSIDLVEFTGLKDKKGKEIYEGDITKTQRWEFSSRSGQVRNGILKHLIKHEKGAFNIRYPERHEVIGNKFENKELLK